MAKSCLYVVKILIILLSILIWNCCFGQIIIDSDGGADDAFAITIAALNEKYYDGPKVVAITTCRGNVDENQAYINIQKTLNVLGRFDIPIYRGFNESIMIEYPSDEFFGVDGLGNSTQCEDFQAIRAKEMSAPEAIIQYANKYGKNLTIIAIGPLTNIALSLLYKNNILNSISHTYVGAGANSGGQMNYPEFNAYMDVEAYYIVMKYATTSSVTLVPITSVHATIGREWRINKFGSIDSPVVKALNSFSAIALKSKETEKYWALLDPFVATALLHEVVVQNITVTKNRIETCGPKRGISYNNFEAGDESNAKIILSFNGNLVQEYLYNLFCLTVSE